MKEISIRKAAIVLGICIIALSVILCLLNEVSFITTFVNNRAYSNSMSAITFYSSFLTPLQPLISGLGFGGIIILLGLRFDSKQTFAMSYDDKADAPEVAAEQNDLN